MSRILPILFVGVLLTLMASFLAAHEIRPAYLGITESEPGVFEVVWKRPIMGDQAVRLVPFLSNGWLDQPEERRTTSDTQRVQVWRINASINSGATAGMNLLEGVVVGVDGLDRTITDVVVHVGVSGAAPYTDILTPGRDSMTLGQVEAAYPPVWRYVEIGFSHIFEGADHLAFVLGLALLVGFSHQLFYAVTAFTLSHSLSLFLATSGAVVIFATTVEVLVAVSLVMLALEVLGKGFGKASLSGRHPWVLAFAFGFVHGFAFAGALADIGFPADSLWSAVLLFNLGVEIGQLVFIGVVMILTIVILRLPQLFSSAVSRRRLLTSLAYGIGIFGMILVLDRLPLRLPIQ